MNAGTYNIKINKGALYDTTFTWTRNGSPAANLTGYTATLNAVLNGTNVLALTTTLDGSGNGIVLGGSACTVEIIIKTAKTLALTFTKAKYALNLTRPDGEDIPFLAGGIYVNTEYPDA